MERRIISAILFLSVVVSLSNFVRQPFWFQEYIAVCWVLLLANHVVLLPVFLFSFLRTKGILWGLSLLFTVYAIVHYSSTLLIFEWKHPAVTPSVTTESLSLFYANTNLYNQDVSGVSSIVTERTPDTVVIVEASESWIMQSRLREVYPYRHEILNRGVWGIALFSRFPLSEIREDLGEDVPPVIIAQMEVAPNRRVPIAAVHLPPPVSQDAWTMARYGARRLSTELRHAREPWIVVGDFNSGPYGRVYESFQNAARVQNAAVGFGLFQTWNAQSQVLRATIDHIFVKDNVMVTNFETVHVVGSDHKGLWMNYHLPSHFAD